MTGVMIGCSSCQSGVRALISRKLGACATCLRLSLLGTATAWAAVAVLPLFTTQPFVLVLVPTVAVSLTLLMLGHLTAATARAVAALDVPGGPGLARRAFAGLLLKTLAAAVAASLVDGISGRARVASASIVSGTPEPQLIRLTHTLDFRLHDRVFAARALFEGDQQTLRVTESSGSSFEATTNATSSHLAIADQSGRSLRLDLTAAGQDLQARVTVGSAAPLSVRAPADGIVPLLNDQIAQHPALQPLIPDMTAFTVLTGALRDQPRFAELLVGHRVLLRDPGIPGGGNLGHVSPTDVICQVACTCCAVTTVFGGGPLCCGICFLCVFSSAAPTLQDQLHGLAAAGP